MRTLVAQFARFGVVGRVGFVIDFGVFNLLRATVFNPEGIHEGPIFAKIISTSIAILANWIGNRLLDVPRAPRPPAAARGHRVRHREHRRHG